MRTIPLPKLTSLARLGVGLTALIVLLAGCSDERDVASDLPPRFEELDLSSPEAAVETFADAFERGDYLTAFRALSVDSQEVVATLPSWFFGGPSTGYRYDWLDTQYRTATAEDLGAWVINRQVEDWNLPSELQGELVLRAMAERGALTVDLTGGISQLQLARADDTEAAVLGVLDVFEEVSVVRIALTTDLDGRWRVHQLLAPGGDDGVFPFAGDPDGSASASVDESWISTAARLRPDDPDLAIARTIAFFDDRDWRMLVGSFHTTTARSAWQGFSSFEFTGRFLALDTPDYAEAWRTLVDEGPPVYGYLTSLPYEHGVATDSLLVDLAGANASPAVRVEDWSGDEAWAAEVTVDDTTYIVTVARSESPAGFAFAQIRTLDGSTDTEAAPFSAPAWGFTVPDGALLCADGIARWDCDAATPHQSLSEADQRRIDELRAEADEDESLANMKNVEIQAIINSARHDGKIDAYCAAMQLGYVHDDSTEWQLSAAEVLTLAEEYCPGDPSVIPTG